MPTCYVIDDEVYALEAMVRHIEKMAELNLLGNHTDPIIALKEISKFKPDIVFLDVEMPELSGVEMADLLPIDTAIVFVTSHARYALNAFEKNAVDFLLKPFNFHQFVKCVHKVLGLLDIRQQAKAAVPITTTQLLIKIGASAKIVNIELTDIIYVEALDHYTHIITTKEKYLSQLSLADLEEKLVNTHFSRIHRKYLINIDTIKFIEKGIVTLSNGSKLSIGETYKPSFLKKLAPKTIKKLNID